MKKMMLTLALILTAVLTRAASIENEYAYAIDLAPVEVTAPALDLPMMVLNLEAVEVTAPALDAVAMVVDAAPVFVTAPALDAAIVLNLDPVVVTASAVDVLYAETLEADSAAVEMY
ncbi:MAG: hypothetical protein IKI72_08955 [Bacteroidales bacterium]|nr:hypothetical protein [Bacteroidales bacterium]